MSLNLLELVREFCGRRSLTKPQIVMTSQDETYLQIVGLLHETIDDLVTRGTWTELQREATWKSTGQENQGPLRTIAPYGYLGITLDTFFDRTARLPVFGPKNPQEWQLLKAMPMVGPYLQYRIEGGNLLLNPVPAVGHDLVFEYRSDFAISDGNDPSIFKRYFSNDKDTCVFKSSLLLAGAAWRWKKEKGLPYSEDFRSYESLLVDLMGRDGGRKVLVQDGGAVGFKPGVFIPTGNWNVK